MRLETRILYSFAEPHNGLGAPRARPPERSGDLGAPRATAKGVRGGEAPRIYFVLRTSYLNVFRSALLIRFFAASRVRATASPRYVSSMSAPTKLTPSRAHATAVLPSPVNGSIAS